MNKISQNVYSKTKTLTDIATQWETTDIWMHDVNIHVYTNDAKYGSFAVCDAIIYANEVAWFRKMNLGQLVMKNSTAGSNAVVTLVGTIGILDKIKGFLKVQ